MRIAIGCDHHGLARKGDLVAALESEGHVVLDLGAFSPDPVDYPDHARVVGQAVLRGFVDLGVLVCGTAAGAAMAANKMRGVRAAPCADLADARQSREQFDANVLCLSAATPDGDGAVELTLAWVTAAFASDEAHVRHVAKVAQLEAAAEPAPGVRPSTARPAGATASRAGTGQTPMDAPSSPQGPASLAGAVSTAAGAPITGVAASGPAGELTPAGASATPAATASSPPGAPAVPHVAAESPAAPAARASAPEVIAGTADPASGRPVASATVPAAGAASTPDATSTAPAAPEAGAPAPEHATRNALDLPLVAETLAFLDAHEFLDRLWMKDAALWRGDAESTRRRLGWLTAPLVMRGHVDDLRAFADEIRRLQFSQVVLLGTGGVVGAAQVVDGVFRSKMGYPDLLVLDSADPGEVKQILDKISVARCLFVVASKSGMSPETQALYAFFRACVEAGGTKAGPQFVAITDPGSPLERVAHESGFRRTFLNAPSIGECYSALSFFGLVPAALMGVDVKGVLDRALAVVEQSGDGSGTDRQPAIRLGAAIAGLAQVGRDKVTLLVSEPLHALAPWIEALLAESLGKDGKGVVPVADEPLGHPIVYGDDRVFVALVLAGDDSFDAALAALDQAGHPVIRVDLADLLDVGAEFFRWQMAAVTAAAVLGVNPFDAPDLAAGRDRAGALLAQLRTSRRLAAWPVVVEDQAVAIATRSASPPASVGEGLAAHLAQAAPDDYVALTAYLPATADVAGRLQALRALIRDRLRVATTVGFGPQCLHATGQMHKGGRPGGLFVQIVGEDKEDLAIPGSEHGFSTLKAALAQGDLEALHDSGRRVLRLRLAGRPAQGLEQLLHIARAATRRL